LKGPRPPCGGRHAPDGSRSTRFLRCTALQRRFTVGLALAFALLACPSAGEAQQTGKVARVGFLYFGSRDPGPGGDRYAAFLEGMRELGYVEGRSLIVEARFADSKPERVPDLVQELLRLKVDTIVAAGLPVYRALRRATTTLPVVVTVTADPVLVGVAASVARPGGNFTGLSDTAADLSPKQLELLKGILPMLSRVGVLLNPDNASHPPQVTKLVEAGQKIGVQVVRAEAATVAQIDPGLALLARQQAHAVILFGDTFFSQQLQNIADGALKYRLPSVYIIREYAEAGGLMSYGANIIDNFRRAATYVDKILKGANPAHLPFEQPTRYALVINMKTARSLGLAIPQSVLLRADSVVD
jgi:putative ABC transport system substrate-binding protein